MSQADALKWYSLQCRRISYWFEGEGSIIPSIGRRVAKSCKRLHRCFSRFHMKILPYESTLPPYSMFSYFLALSRKEYHSDIDTLASENICTLFLFFVLIRSGTVSWKRCSLLSLFSVSFSSSAKYELPALHIGVERPVFFLSSLIPSSPSFSPEKDFLLTWTEWVRGAISRPPKSGSERGGRFLRPMSTCKDAYYLVARELLRKLPDISRNKHPLASELFRIEASHLTLPPSQRLKRFASLLCFLTPVDPIGYHSGSLFPYTLVENGRRSFIIFQSSFSFFFFQFAFQEE